MGHDVLDEKMHYRGFPITIKEPAVILQCHMMSAL